MLTEATQIKETNLSHLREVIGGNLTFFGVQGHRVTRMQVEECKDAKIIFESDIRQS